MTAPPTVVGIDLSLTAAGIATPAGLRTVGEKGKAGATLDDRRRRITRQVGRVLSVVLDGTTDLAAADPMVVVIEAPAPSRVVGHQHDRSGLWWLIVTTLAAWPHVHVVEVSPSGRAKYATGRGNAAKADVLLAVARRFADHEVSNDNEADALVLRAMALDHYGAPLAPMPAANRQALDAVAWPTIPAEVTA